MRKSLLILLLPALLAGCAQARQSWQLRQDRDSYAHPFYERYLNPANALDKQIMMKVEALRANPRSAALHNDLGAFLVARNLPRDAESEFLKAVHLDRHFYQAWYNLGLIREAQGDTFRAALAYRRTLSVRPGHPFALFHLGLIEEKTGNNDAAIDHYARAFIVNHSMLDVRYNPRIVDTKLTDLALLRAYPREHGLESMQPQPSPAMPLEKIVPNRSAPAKAQPQPEQIVTPAPPATQPAVQTPPPTVAPPPPTPQEPPASTEEPTTQPSDQTPSTSTAPPGHREPDPRAFTPPKK